MNQLIPAHHRSFEYAARGIVLLALAHLCWLQLSPESEWHRFWAVATEPATRRMAGMERKPSDRVAGPSVDGNVLLRLAGYAKTNPVVANSLGYFYFRAGYDYYPIRVYAAAADQVVNNGQDIMRIVFSPDRQWLQAHAVRSVLMFGNDTAGGNTPRLEMLPPRDGQDGTQTNLPGGN